VYSIDVLIQSGLRIKNLYSTLSRRLIILRSYLTSSQPSVHLCPSVVVSFEGRLSKLAQATLKSPFAFAKAPFMCSSEAVGNTSFSLLKLTDCESSATSSKGFWTMPSGSISAPVSWVSLKAIAIVSEAAKTLKVCTNYHIGECLHPWTSRSRSGLATEVRVWGGSRGWENVGSSA
jgi:hypothetical protein